ncbi:hypothetical protein [Confluentibacter flavum]|uniref:hypothetical protein n=1 Tax=Confluentibacter flavum TaxID=1909700 RepID=UPI0012FF40B4|nr:hypothetical protein [Confluentibacter flavum]
MAIIFIAGLFVPYVSGTVLYVSGTVLIEYLFDYKDDLIDYLPFTVLVLVIVPYLLFLVFKYFFKDSFLKT